MIGIWRQHVRDRFGAAYDGELDPAEMAGFDEHLQRCSECAAHYEQFRLSLGALAALPQARMPRAVHVPSDGVRHAPRRGRGLNSRVLVPVGACACALAAVAVVMLAVHSVHSGPGAAAPASLAYGAVGGGSCDEVIAVVPSTQVRTLPGNAVVARESGADGQVLQLDTESAQVTAGHDVTVDVSVAGGTASGAGGGEQACVTLSSTPSSEVTLAPPVVAPAGAGAARADAGAVIRLHIPSGVAAGTTLRVAVTIEPQSAGASPLTAVLALSARP